MALVQRYWNGPVVDIGIGGGRFVLELDADGFDVNPAAIAWLKRNGKWFDVYRRPMAAATFWDSLEHIADPAPILINVRGLAFISAPIYANGEAILGSKHFKPTEHFWYWTHAGLVSFMADYGFALVASNSMECPPREGIETFVFSRRQA
jgi:hypothetical protein